MRIPDFAIVLVVVAIVASIFLWLPEGERVPEHAPTTTRTPNQQDLPELGMEIIGEPRSLNELVIRVSLESQQAFKLGISNGNPVAWFLIRSPQRRWSPVPPGITDRTIEIDHFEWEIRGADFDEDHCAGLEEAFQSESLVAEVETFVRSASTGRPTRLSARVKLPKLPAGTPTQTKRPVDTGFKIRRVLPDGSTTEDTTVRF